MSGNTLGNMQLIQNWRRSDQLSFTKWNENRMIKPEEFMLEETFTDFKLTVGSKIFHTHKLILGIHSEYFYRLLLSGMKETSQNEMEFKDMDPEIFQIIINYIYSGTLECDLDDETLTEVYLVANMLQILDLEAECIAAILTNVNTQNCLEKKCRLDKMNIYQHQPQKRVLILQSLDEFICSSVSDHWKILIQSPGFLQLDSEGLCLLLEMKSSQDEITDFSYSFVQNDIIKGVINWLNHDLDSRHENIWTLATFYCLHQANNAMVKKLFDIYQKCKITLNIDQVCQGRLCGNRVLQGLLIISGLSLNYGCERLMYHFVIPSSQPFDVKETILTLNRPYVLPPIIQDIGRDEQLFIQPQNFVPLGNLTYMVLSQNKDKKLVGNYLDALTKKSQCSKHHSDMYYHCPTNFPTCECDEGNHWSICFLDKIWMISSCGIEDILEKSERFQYDPSCAIYKLIKSPISVNGLCTLNDNGSIIAFGGYRSKVGLGKINVVSCTLTHFKGHTSIKTQVLSYDHVPIANQTVFKYYAQPDSWLTVLDTTPFSICSAACIKINDAYYVCGGFTLQHDKENQLYYYQPLTTLWTLDLKSEKWSQGPVMPVDDGLDGYASGSVYLVKNQLIYSGGVRLKTHAPYESNQIYKYVTNSKVLSFDLVSFKWEIILDLSDIGSTIYGVVPSEVHLKELRVHAGEFVSL